MGRRYHGAELDHKDAHWFCSHGLSILLDANEVFAKILSHILHLTIDTVIQNSLCMFSSITGKISTTESMFYREEDAKSSQCSIAISSTTSLVLKLESHD